MLLSITTTHEPATDLGYLLHKSPGRVHEVVLPFGTARVFYAEAGAERCTAVLHVEVDPIGLVRKAKDSSDSGPLVAYVNDRPYVASSMLGTALTSVYGTAMGGRSRERQELADSPISLEVCLPVTPCRGGEALLRGLFEPLGYTVHAEPIPLDPAFPAWGQSRYFSVRLSTTARLADVLAHIYVLAPVLDDDKHYWIGTDEVEKLVRKGAGSLETHPLKTTIVARALRRRQRFVRAALDRLSEADEGEAAPDDGATTEEEVERPLSLNEQRLGAVMAVLRSAGAKRILDLGCGEGRLLTRLAAEPTVERLLGIDVAFRAVESARAAVARLPRHLQSRVEVQQGSLMYRDNRLQGWDAAAMVEVIEHIEPGRLRWLEDAVFVHAKPATIVVTTPNAEYNIRFATLAAGASRHGDHRFEWNRAELRGWAEACADAHGYTVRYLPVGPEDFEVGPPTQMVVFERWS
jgi:3' terminal RNA ribose 2'-O-methyltransferase Hen1